MPIDDRTSTQNYPKPNIANTLADDVGRLRTALDDIDTDINALAPKASPVFTGTAAIPVGSASAPSLYFTGDPNTGLYSPGADQVALSTGGTGRLFIDASGRVGVGTTSPSAALHVQSAVPQVFFSNSASTAADKFAHICGLQRANDTEPEGFSIIGSQSTSTDNVVYIGGFFGEANAATAQVFYTAANNTTRSGTERARIDSSGRVGIGTTSPAVPLEVNGAIYSKVSTTADATLAAFNSIASVFLLQQSDKAHIYTGAGQPIVFTNSNVERARIDSSGRLGLGTSNPGSVLDARAAGSNAALSLQETASYGVIWKFDIGTSNELAISNNAVGNLPIVFKPGPAEVARIDSSGRLLVGTSSNIASGLVQFGQNTGTASTTVQTIGSNAAAAFWLTRSNANAIVASGEAVGVLDFRGYDGASYQSLGFIRGEVDGTPGANDMPGRLVFSTTADGASSPTERLRITSAGVLQIADAGNISVGTTTGTKIGTATTQKLGFFDKTPVVQPTAVADATDAASVITQLNALLARMRDLGLIAT